MSCLLKADERADMLLAHVSRRLSTEAAARLDAHARSCSACAFIVRKQSAIADALDAWHVPPVSEDFDSRLLARWQAAQAAPWTDRAAAVLRDCLRPVFSRPAFPLAFAAAILISGFVLDHPSKRGATASASVLQQDLQRDVQQMESTLDDLDMLHQFDTTPAEQGKPGNSM